MHSLKKISPNKERAKSLYLMALKTEKMLSELSREYTSIIIKEYYNLIRELITAILYCDGFKATGEGSHIKSIYYLKNLKQFHKHELIFIVELREIRNRLSYEGFSIEEEFLNRKIHKINDIIIKLKIILKKKLQQNS